MKKNAKKTPLNEEFEDVKMEVTKICHAIEVLQKHRMNKMDRYKKGLWSKLEKDKVLNLIQVSELETELIKTLYSQLTYWDSRSDTEKFIELLDSERKKTS